MSLHFRIAPTGGYQSIFERGEHGIRWLGMAVLRLDAGESWQGRLGEEEAALVVLSGHGTISIRSSRDVDWEGVGSRECVFAGLPTAVYVPRKSGIEVRAGARLELAIAKAPCDCDRPPMLVTPADIARSSVGGANCQREVRLIIPPDSSVSQRLIVGETLNPPANWSGIPPHKHDQISDCENPFDEFYWFKTNPPDGYAIQVSYREDHRSALVVGNDEVIVTLNSYHPTVAFPGTTVCYLWALAGPSKTYRVSIDPRFAWVREVERTPEGIGRE